MSADIKTLEYLRKAALACNGWNWPDRMRDENGMHHFGLRREGEFHALGTIDVSNYTFDYADDIRVLKFIRAAQPETILALVDEVADLRAALAAESRKSLELSRVYAERGLQIERLELALSRAAATAPQPVSSDERADAGKLSR